jgi:hypothetical protein
VRELNDAQMALIDMTKAPAKACIDESLGELHISSPGPGHRKGMGVDESIGFGSRQVNKGEGH